MTFQRFKSSLQHLNLITGFFLGVFKKLKDSRKKTQGQIESKNSIVWSQLGLTEKILNTSESIRVTLKKLENRKLAHFCQIIHSTNNLLTAYQIGASIFKRKLNLEGLAFTLKEYA